MDCQYCQKSFSNKYLLTQHQTKAKYCLSLQGMFLDPKDKDKYKYKCRYCSKLLCSNERLRTHFETCKEKIKKEYDEKNENENSHLQQIISEQQITIVKLEAKLEKFENAVIASASEPRTKTNTTNVVASAENKDAEMPIPLHEQMSSIVIEEIKDDDDKEHYSNIILNNVVITSRPIDHYVNATQLCQAGGKKFNDWLRLDTTKELINELSAEAGIPASALVQTKRGGNDKLSQGSWIHPDLSIQLAQWISPKFAIQVSKWVRTLFNQGSIEIDLNLLHEKERDMRIKDHRIKQLESVCLSKQRRVEYPEHNVIYMLTTDDHLQRRTYVIGKAKNLTNRLSTYNKTCDHTVVHYRECKSEEDMETVETMVLSKLRDFREQANRDRFILPNDKEVSYFIETIDECARFLA